MQTIIYVQHYHKEKYLYIDHIDHIDDYWEPPYCLLMGTIHTCIKYTHVSLFVDVPPTRWRLTQAINKLLCKPN